MNATSSLTRRGFVLGSVAACLAAARAGAAQAPRPRITFSFSLYGMQSLDLNVALETCAKIGYDGVELATMPKWPANPLILGKMERARLRQRLRDLNLSLPALMENLPLDVEDKVHQSQLERLRAAAELGHDLSPDAPPLVETILGGKAGQWDTVRKRYADRLGDWTGVAAKTRTVVALKPHRTNAMNLPEHALWLLEQVKSPWLKLGYDFSHFQYRNLTLENTLKAMLPETRFVHVKDVRIEKERVQFLLPGDSGQIDYVQLLKQLQGGGYQGTVCVEVSGMISNQKGYDPVAAARRCYQNLQPAFTKAGLRK